MATHAGCDHAVKILSGLTASAAKLGAPVQCGSCKHPFCFGCSEPVHQPVDCTMLRLWKKKCADDSETANWISSNTKECPKCNVTMEKNGGCNHMHCPEKSCRYEFCWICLGPWEPHGSSWYNCSRFDEKDVSAEHSCHSSALWHVLEAADGCSTPRSRSAEGHRSPSVHSFAGTLNALMHPIGIFTCVLC